MKKVLSVVLCIAGTLFFDCNSLFPTNYDRVDAERVRVLDYKYEPADAAPGSVVKVYVTLAGAGAYLKPDAINWTVSYNVLSNSNGVDTALNIGPLRVLFISEIYFSDITRCYIYYFRIPDSVVIQSVSIPEDWTSLIPEGYQSGIPDFILSLSKTDFISFIHNLAMNARKWERALFINPSLEDSLLQADTLYVRYKDSYSRYLPALLQLLTIKIRLFSDISGVQKVRSTNSVRYNSYFDDLPESPVHVNKNPVIDSVGIYKVKKENLLFFDPEKDTYDFEFKRLFNHTDTVGDSIHNIEIDKKCSYFVAGFASGADSSRTLKSALQNGPVTIEGFSTQWYFQLDQNEIVGVSPYDFMNIMSTGNFIDVLYPPEDNKIETFALWLEVSDYHFDEINRPQGSTLKEVWGKFKYK